jgi:hypothetical protein
MQGILYEESSAWLFLLVTVIMGGAAAWQTGRAVASVWKPRWQLVFYMFCCWAWRCASRISPCSRAHCSACTTISSTRSC